MVCFPQEGPSRTKQERDIYEGSLSFYQEAADGWSDLGCLVDVPTTLIGESTEPQYAEGH